MKAIGMPMSPMKQMLVKAASIEMNKRMGAMTSTSNKNKINPVMAQRLPDVKKMQDSLKVKPVKIPKKGKLP